MKKKTLCWLFQNHSTKLSSDRLLRVRGVQNKTKTNSKAKRQRIIGNKQRRTKSRNCLSASSSEESEFESITLSSEEDHNWQTSSEEENSYFKIELEKYYAVFYDEDWFIGRVLNVEEKVKVKFLVKDLDQYVWPKREDVQYVDARFIFHGPVSLEGNCPFAIKRSEKSIIIQKYKKIKQCS